MRRMQFLARLRSDGARFLRGLARSLTAAPALVLILASSCSVIAPDHTSRLGREAIVYSTRAALNSEDCATGNLLVRPWFNSVYSDNEARLLMAAVHGCYAGVKILDLMANLVSKPNALNGAGFWAFLTEYFPSTNVVSDRKLENALFAIDSAQAAVIPGLVLNPMFTVNAAGFNPQSLVVEDRVADANAYHAFSGMAAMGAIQNRFGAPNAAFVKTVPLVGQTAVTVNAVACQYASAMVNFMDGIHGLALSATGPMAAALRAVDNNFTALISGSCSLGCKIGRAHV